MRGIWLQEPKNGVAIVFVHGILSDSAKCWTNSNGSNWPSLICEDESLTEYGVYEFTYKTGATSGDYGVGDAADALKEQLHHDGVFGMRSIAFVCHSMGGIVVRKFLIDRVDDLKNLAIALLLVGSPSLGSRHAALFRPLSFVLRHWQGKILLPADSNVWLMDLNKSFLRLKESGNLDIRGRELIEDEGYFGLSILRLVSTTSASAYFADPYKVPGSNHSTIAKPFGSDAIQYKILAGLVRQLPVKDSVDGEGKNRRKKNTAAGDALFDVYGPQHHEYYFERHIDTLFSEALVTHSVWLYGVSGSGKTSIVRRYIDKSANKPAEISLSLLGPDASRQEVVSEVIDSLCVYLNREETVSKNLSEAVKLCCEISSTTVLVLFLDEVPVANSVVASNIIDIIGALLDGVKRAGCHVRFVVCSLGAPPVANGRFQEQFSVVPLSSWMPSELESLVDIIMRVKPDLSLTTEELSKVITAASGSPRFVKTFFRKKITSRQKDVHDLIASTRDALRGL